MEAVTVEPVEPIAWLLAGALAFVFRDDLLAIGKQLAGFVRLRLIPGLCRFAEDILRGTVIPLVKEAALTFSVWADLVDRVLSFITTRFSDELQFLRKLFTVAFEAYSVTFNTAFENLATVASIGLLVLRGDVQGVFEGIGNIVVNSVDAITSIAGKLVGFICNEFDFADALFTKFEAAFPSVLSAARSFIDAIISTLNEVPGVSISVDLPSIPSFDAPDTGDAGDAPSGTDSSGLLPDIGPIGGEPSGSPDFGEVGGIEAPEIAPGDDSGGESNGVRIKNLEVNANGEREGREAGQALKDELKSLNI